MHVRMPMLIQPIRQNVKQLAVIFALHVEVGFHCHPVGRQTGLDARPRCYNGPISGFISLGRARSSPYCTVISPFMSVGWKSQRYWYVPAPPNATSMVPVAPPLMVSGTETASSSESN